MRYLTLLFAVAIAAVAPAAHAAEYNPFAIYHVAENGSDANPGSAARPFRTITKALAVSQSYEVVLVRPGSYPKVTDTIGRNYGPVIVRGLGNREARVAGGMIAGARHVRFENLSWEGEVMVRTHPTLGAARPATGIQVVDSHFTRGAGSLALCMSIRGGAQQVLVEGNSFENCGYGIAGPGTAERDPAKITNARHITIRNNVMDGFRVDAIQFTNWSDVTIDQNIIRNMYDPGGVEHNDGIQIMGNSHRIRITNNRISNAPTGQLVFAQDAISGGNSDLLVRNNLIYKAGAQAVQLGGTHGTRVINNTAWGGRWASIMLGKDSGLGPANHIVVNNIADNLSSRDWGHILERDYNLMLKSNMGPYPHDLLGVDPGFVDAAGFDFRLSDTSPALGSGDPRHAPPVDRDGDGRIDPASRGWFEEADGLHGEPPPLIPTQIDPPPPYELPSWRLGMPVPATAPPSLDPPATPLAIRKDPNPVPAPAPAPVRQDGSGAPAPQTKTGRGNERAAKRAAARRVAAKQRAAKRAAARRIAAKQRAAKRAAARRVAAKQRAAKRRAAKRRAAARERSQR